MKEAKLEFKNFIVSNFEFEKFPKNTEEDIFYIIPNAAISRKKKQFHINIIFEMLDIENHFQLRMVCTGIFEYNTENQEELTSYLSINGPAIIFPYIRSFISNFTALSGLDTVTLPTLNLSGFRDDIIENLIEIDGIENE
ncbi:conserved protein of unknown function [Tenacibaculum sp. 190524A02b]|uniref:protein-export chaperone SecB n=1 Tax=Tenacibaculum vairaonense TaxID=3137860 RepID=UPI0032B149D2